MSEPTQIDEMLDLVDCSSVDLNRLAREVFLIKYIMRNEPVVDLIKDAYFRERLLKNIERAKYLLLQD